MSDTAAEVCYKVEYYLLPELTHHSKAYLDREFPETGVCTGTDKYTDEPICVRWTGERWEQLPAEFVVKPWPWS